MPITFGSVGDVISVSLLIKDLFRALDGARGSSADYEAVVRELVVLDTALLHVEQLSRSNAPTPELHALYETAKRSVDKCRITVDSFTKRIKKFGSSLKQGGSGNVIKDAAKKIKWEVCQRDEVARFRVEIAGYSDSINMLVNTANVALLKVANADVNESIEKSTEKTQASLDRQDERLKNIQGRLDETNQLILVGSSITQKVNDRLEWFRKLGTELKSYMYSIIATNLRIYREVVAIRTALTQISRPLAEDPFTLEDPIGRMFPVHLRFITSWQAFESVMELNFKGKKGFGKVQKKDYILHDSASNKEIARAQDWDDAFLPGQKVDMSLIFRNEATSDEESELTSCPHCHTISQEPAERRVQCAKCNRWFCRIVEVYEVEAPISPQSFQIPVRRKDSIRFGETSLKENRPIYGPITPPTTPLGFPAAASSKHKIRLEENDEEEDTTGINRIHFLTRRLRYKSGVAFTSFTASNPFESLKDGSQPCEPPEGDWNGWNFQPNIPAPYVEDEEASGDEKMEILDDDDEKSIQDDDNTKSNIDSQTGECKTTVIKTCIQEEFAQEEPITYYGSRKYANPFTTPRPRYGYNSPRHSYTTTAAREESVLKPRTHFRRPSYALAEYPDVNRASQKHNTKTYTSSPTYYFSQGARNSSYWRHTFVDDDFDMQNGLYATNSYPYEYEPYGLADKRTQPYPRGASKAIKTSLKRPKSSVAKKKSPSVTSRKATEEDARRAGIPTGFSFKNWDPEEEPMILLGSVFDANSLGKWIYDWTVFAHGPATPMSDIAGDMWLLMIQLASKIRRADDIIEKIANKEKRDLVEDFLESGERLWVRLKKLLKICEEYMWKAAIKENENAKPKRMNANSGREFVDSIFGRDRELEKTEKLMSAIRLWTMRFDSNCEEILRNPTRPMKSESKQPVEEPNVAKEDATDEKPEEMISSIEPEGVDASDPHILDASRKRKLEGPEDDEGIVASKRQNNSEEEFVPVSANLRSGSENAAGEKGYVDSQSTLKRKAKEPLRPEDDHDSKKPKILLDS